MTNASEYHHRNVSRVIAATDTKGISSETDMTLMRVVTNLKKRLHIIEGELARRDALANLNQLRRR